MPDPKPDFATWRHENLVRLAEECYKELKAMQQEIDQLKEERRVAIDAYRQLLRDKHDT